MLEGFESFKQKVHDLSVERNLHLKKLEDYNREAESLDTRICNTEKARAFLRAVAQEVQQNLEVRLSNIVSAAILSVFEDDPPDFVVRFVERRNTIECDMLFSKKGNEYPPLKGGGFGVADVGDFACRIAYWSLNKNRPSFILDEPFKFVSHDLQPKVSKMLKMLCQELGLQIIMVSHQPGINKDADMTFSVEQGRVTQDPGGLQDH